MDRHSWLVWAVFFSVGIILGDCTPTTERQPGTPVSMKPRLLYIMMDGFRWDYVDLQRRELLPNFMKFLGAGVRARWMNPLFPSLSYPTWTTLVTGQYAETHGIVGNYFYDSETKEVFSLFDPESTGKQKWWTSEPIWTTAEKAGLKTAQYLWARCDVPIDGITTHYCEHFKKIPGKEPFRQRIMNALDKFDKGYDFVQVYTEHTDHNGHNYGPDSEQVTQAVRDLDDVVGILMDELDDRGLTDHVNIVIVSDHGMMYTAPGSLQRREIDLYLNTSLVEHIADKGALMSIKVPQENIEEVYQKVSQIPDIKVYRKEEIPEHYHFKNGKYVQDILLVASKDSFLMASKSEKQLPPRDDSFVYYGAHGYDPNIQDMKGIFFAKGPAFRKGVQIDPIHVVDVYQVLTYLLGVKPNPHNGTWEVVQIAFDPSYKPPVSGSSEIVATAMYVVLAVVFSQLVCEH